MPVFTLWTSTSFHNHEWFSRLSLLWITRPNEVTSGDPVGIWIMSVGFASPSWVARAQTKLFIVEPGSYGSVKLRLRPSDGWIRRAGSRVASRQPGRSCRMSAIARMSPLPASMTMTRPPPAFLSFTILVRCRSADSWMARSMVRRTSWPGSPGT